MPFPPQQADEHCKGTGQGELKLKLKLNQDYSDQLQPFWVQCKGVQARAPRNWELPRLLFERSRKGKSYGKNTRSFGHCQNYYINRKDLSLSLWSNDQMITMVNFLERHLVHRGLPVPPSCGMGQVKFHESCFIIMIIIIMGQEIIRSFILLQFTL